MGDLVHFRQARTTAAVAIASAGCLVALMAGPASASVPAPSPSAGHSVSDPTLSDVSCASASSCVAVGSYEGVNSKNENKEYTFAEAWNGTTWRVVSSLTPEVDAEGGAVLNAVSCATSTRCIAVGVINARFVSETGLIVHPLAESWNGTRWSIIPTASLGHSSGALNGVSCTSPSNCMVVGSEGPPLNSTAFTLAETWNGTTWKHVPTPPVRGFTAFDAVSCSSPASCMATGYSAYDPSALTMNALAEAWNGTRWRKLAAPSPGQDNELSDVACTAASACMAVGAQNDDPPQTATLSERWNGTRWAIQRSPNPGSGHEDIFSAVSCTARAACIAIGGFDPGSSRTRGLNLAAAWNGTSWRRLKIPTPETGGPGLAGMACTSSSNCMAVGTFSNGGTPSELLAEAWNGTSWRVIKIPEP